MKTIILTHNDLDGAGAYFVLEYFNVSYDEIRICNYNDFDVEEEFQKLLKFDKIILTDYSVTKQIVERLLEQNKQVLIIDHHANPQTQELNSISNPNFEYVFNNEKSGTLLTYEYFKPANVRTKKIFNQLITLIDAYDLYKTESELWEDAQNCNRIFYGCIGWGEKETDIKRYQFIKDYWFSKIAKFNDWQWSDFEKKKITPAIATEDKQFYSAVSTMRKYTDDQNHKYAVIAVEKKVSIVCNRILKEHLDVDYVIAINTFNKSWDKISLRSLKEKNFNCNQFEQVKGHDQAAGGEVDPQYAMKLYKGQEKLTYKTGDTR